MFFIDFQAYKERQAAVCRLLLWWQERMAWLRMVSSPLCAISLKVRYCYFVFIQRKRETEISNLRLEVLG